MTFQVGAGVSCLLCGVGMVVGVGVCICVVVCVCVRGAVGVRGWGMGICRHGHPVGCKFALANCAFLFTDNSPRSSVRATHMCVYVWV